MSIPVRPFRIFSKIPGDIHGSRCTTGVNDTGGKWKKSSSSKIIINLFGHLWVVELAYIYIFAFKFTLRYLQPDIVPIICHRYQRHRWQICRRCRWYRLIRDPGFGAFLTPGPRSGIRNSFFLNPDPGFQPHIFLRLSDKFLGKKFYDSLKTGPNYFLQQKKVGQQLFFHPSLLLLFLVPGSGIWDPGSGMGKNQDPGTGIISRIQKKFRIRNTGKAMY